MRLDQKTALITGGASGIGLATARLFIAEGARVAITGRDQQKLDAVARELGPNALALQADTTDQAAMERAVRTVVETFGKIDILFANAGIGGQTPVEGGSVAEFEKILRINLVGPFLAVSTAAPYLNDGASVILIGSVLSEAGAPGWSAYAASKGGINSMAKVLASELSPRGIRVNVVSPAAIRTPIWDVAAPTADAFSQLERRMARSIPLGRIGEPDEVAKLVLYLASDESSFLQATNIFVDGGMIGAPSGAPAYRPSA
jgi:NAD(P)-dependent dehydrogenase (short-subunit alcohol dehydrogenase family)